MKTKIKVVSLTLMLIILLGILQPFALTSFAVDDSWGKEVNGGTAENSCIYYVNQETGETSAEVTDNGICWLKEDSAGSSAWYGFDNSFGIVPHGSRFSVRWISIADDPDFFKETERINDNRVGEFRNAKPQYIGERLAFRCAVTTPEGEEAGFDTWHGYTGFIDFDPAPNLYIQLGTDWDLEELSKCFTAFSDDISVHIVVVENFVMPDGSECSVARISTGVSSFPGSFFTSGNIALIGGCVAVVCAVIYFACKKKKSAKIEDSEAYDNKE
jgi:hypothetical protein